VGLKSCLGCGETFVLENELYEHGNYSSESPFVGSSA